uniref:Secreted protein n=1 Tax=Syphacia muris TaxID=451379 RepID=A0A0N5AK47_9BILA
MRRACCAFAFAYTCLHISCLLVGKIFKYEKVVEQSDRDRQCPVVVMKIHEGKRNRACLVDRLKREGKVEGEGIRSRKEEDRIRNRKVESDGWQCCPLYCPPLRHHFPVFLSSFYSPSRFGRPSSCVISFLSISTLEN